MEIRNIKLLVQGTGKFRIPDEGGQGRDSPKSMWGLVNSSLHCAGQGEDKAPVCQGTEQPFTLGALYSSSHLQAEEPELSTA